MSKSFVFYFRVSTKQQGRSGLGIEAQRTMAAPYRQQGRVLAEFVEVETGKIASRPQLDKAIDLCRQSGAVLIIAKLDRLFRNVEETARMMNSGIEFICCDNPHADRFTLHIIAAMDEAEARRISERTKNALAHSKKKLGAANPKVKAALEGKRGKWKRPPSKLLETYREQYSIIKTLRSCGKTYRQIVAYLNEQGHRSSEGNPFSLNLVYRISKCESTLSKPTSTILNSATDPENYCEPNAPSEELLAAS